MTLLGSVWIAKAAGVWQTSGRGQVLLDAGGRPDPAGIKGWMTLSGISETYGVPLEALYAMIGAGSDIPADTALKDLESVVPGMEVSAVRTGVAAYLDGSWIAPEGGERIMLPETVEETPPVEPTPTLEATEEHAPQGSGKGSGAGLVLPEDGSALPGSQIKGRMTLQEVVDLCQVPLAYLVVELGLPEDVDPQLRMRDLAGQLGIEVLTVREVVERYQTGQ
jgi:hypothetical protein